MPTSGRPTARAAPIPTLDSFLADVVDIMREEVAELVRLGATYIQIDAPHYPLLLDPDTRAFYEGQGWTLDTWLSRGIEMDNAVIAGFPGVTFSMHLCRGNQGSRWLTQGGYDLIARPIFRGVRVQRLLLEYDDERSGSFEPLAEVPDDKVVVLGLVTTKTPREETVAGLTRAHRGGQPLCAAGAPGHQPAVRLCHVGDRQRHQPGRREAQAESPGRYGPGGVAGIGRSSI